MFLADPYIPQSSFFAITRAKRAKQIWIFRRIFISKFSDRSAVQADFSVQQQK